MVKGSGFIEANQDGTFNAKQSLSFQRRYNVKNLPNPQEVDDASNKFYVDETAKRIKREIEENTAFEKNGGEYEFEAKGYIDFLNQHTLRN